MLANDAEGLKLRLFITATMCSEPDCLSTIRFLCASQAFMFIRIFKEFIIVIMDTMKL